MESSETDNERSGSKKRLEEEKTRKDFANSKLATGGYFQIEIKRLGQKIFLKNDDPLIATPYNVLYFQVDAEAKRFSAELKNALITLNKMKIEPPPISVSDLKRL